jgi:nicotinate-nucleotide adenylyltransferase
MKIGIFGGAFNPIHYGHLRTAEEILEILALDKVFFIPSGKPAFRKPQLVTARHRYEMVKIAINDNPHFTISDIEIKTRGKSYTADTLRKLKRINKNKDFYLMLGIDAFKDLQYWKDPDILVNLSNLVIISRPGHYFNELSSSPYFKKTSKKLLKELDKGFKTVFSFSMPSGQRCFLCKVTEINTSASYIRETLLAGKGVKYLLPDSVKSYIISHKLYFKK